MSNILEILQEIIDELGINPYTIAYLARLPIDRIDTIITEGIGQATEEEADAIVKVVSTLSV